MHVAMVMTFERCKISSSDLVWLLSYACLIKEEEEEEEEEQCGKLHRNVDVVLLVMYC